MKIAVLSDIHANYAAFKAVLADVRRQNVDGVWVLGDIIGRGCDPQAVAAEMWLLHDEQSSFHRKCWLSGNHERFVLGNLKETDLPVSGYATSNQLVPIDGSNQYAVQVALDHTDLLENDKDLLMWLYQMPTYHEPYDGIYLVHAAMRFNTDTGKMSESETYGTYLMEESAISAQFRECKQFAPNTPRLILGGHTHISGLWGWHDDALVTYDLGVSHHFDMSEQILYANPGSVGFPRGADHCPTYMTLNFDEAISSVHVQRHIVKYQPDKKNCWSDYPEYYLDEMDRCND